MRHIIPFTTFFLLLSLGVLAQPDTRGSQASTTSDKTNWFSKKTHVLIVGISDYDTYRDLDFADDDARAFYNYLIDAQKIDTNNIHLLVNERATHGNVGMELMKILQRIKKGIIKPGENLIIYFAGHGDCDGDEAYWLCHNAPNGADKNLYRYSGGTIRMSDVKRDISSFTKDYQLNVLLITDACRTNEVPGGAEGLKGFQNLVMDKRAGEIQLSSCSVNQQAHEDKRWGGGRGVFSYYLVNGLSGLADKNDDKNVSLFELKNYLEENVMKETGGAQIPDICCSDKLANIITSVDDKILAKVNAQQINDPITNALSMNGRGASNSQSLSDSMMDVYYNEFKYSISCNKLLRTSDENTNFASDVIYSVQGKTKSILLDDMIYELCGKLIDELQTDINQIIQNDKTVINYPLNEAKAEYILSLIDTNYIFYKEVDYLRVLFGQHKIQGKSPQEINAYLKNLEEKEKEFPNSALLHFQKGYWLMNNGQILEATRAYNKSIELAPNFAMAYNNLANLYWRTNRPQLAEKTYQDMVSKNPKSALMYGNYAYFLYEWDKNRPKDAEMYFKKAISFEPTTGQIFNNYGLLLMDTKRYADAELQMQKAIEFEPDNELYFFNYGMLMLKRNKPDIAMKLFKKAQDINPQFHDAGKMIYQILNKTSKYGDSH